MGASAGAFTPRLSSTIFTPTLAPMRSAPAWSMALAPSRSRTPPAAFTPMPGPTTRRMRATSAAVAPPGPKPVEVFTKSAPAARESTQAFTFSSSVSRAVSMMTLTRAPAGRQASTTPAMSRATRRWSPDLSAPTFMTMSTSAAPSATERAASNAFTSGRVAPRGKPATVQTAVSLPASSWAHSRTQ